MSFARHSRQLHDPRLRDAVHRLKQDFAVTAVCFGGMGNEVYSGSIDNTIQVRGQAQPLQGRHRPLKHRSTLVALRMRACLSAARQVWDLRRQAVSLTLTGHADSITSLRLSPEGGHVLSNSMDSTRTRWGGSAGAVRSTTPALC